MTDLHESLTYINIPKAYSLNLEVNERFPNIYSGLFPENVLETSKSYVLAVSSSIRQSEVLNRIPAQITISAKDQLYKLVQSHTPGITLDSLAVCPREIPYHQGFVYFTISNSHPMWKDVQDTRRAPHPSKSQFNDNSHYSRSTYKTLTDAASNLLILVGHVSNTLETHDTNALKQKVSTELNTFSQKAKSLNFGEQVIHDATYVLCTAIDEAVLNTPWGERSGWSQNSLLSIYFGNVAGGNSFFERLKKLGEDPSRNHQLLGAKLSQIRQWTAEKIRPFVQLQSDPYLSPRWEGIKQRKSLLPSFIPMWSIGVATLGLLLGCFSFFFLNLTHASGDVIRDMQALQDTPPPIEVKEIEVYVPYEPPEPTLPKLSVVFADESRLSIDDENPLHTSIRIRSDSLFNSGSATMTNDIQPLLNELASEMNIRPGQIKVTGHTDNIKISSSLKLKFPTNQILSQARADTVANIINDNLDDKERLSTQGKGSSNPIVGNETREGRSRNRRVEIDIYN